MARSYVGTIAAIAVEIESISPTTTTTTAITTTTGITTVATRKLSRKEKKNDFD